MALCENVNPKNEYFSRLEVDDEDGSEFTDKWNTGELLCLASAVQRSGDKNWVSVSRAIKPFGEPKRPTDWYSPKNCALQYSKLLKGVEDFKKKSLPRTERETSEELLVKNLTDKRISELNWLNQQTKVLANSMKVHMELFEAGEYDENLDELIKQIEEQEKREEDDFKEWIVKRDSLNAAKKLNKCRVPLTKAKNPLRSIDNKRKNSSNSDQLEDISMHSFLSDITIKTEVESDQEISMNVKPITIKQEIPDVPSNYSALLEVNKTSNIISSSSGPTTPTSPLLTSLLRSVPSSNTSSPVVSYVSSPLKEVKTESPSQSSPSSADNTRKTEVFLSPTKTVTASISPLLTSLLKSPTSAAPTSTSMASHCKEADGTDTKSVEIDMAALIAKSHETSPRSSSASHSPRPTPASSPLLNSLLKSSPSSVSSLSSPQLSQNKETGSLKAVSSPQPFFSPTNVLATAAAQQLAVATSSFSTSHIFFPQETSESPKKPIQSSTTTSACLSAPTLSKLLEMPPSTPGKLPPLPVVETPTIIPSAPEQIAAQSPQKIPTATMLLNELELQLSSTSPSKIPVETSISPEIETVSSVDEEKETPVPITSVDAEPIPVSSYVDAKSSVVEQPIPIKHSIEIDNTSQKNVDILEAVCESYQSMPLEKKETKELLNTNANNLLDKPKNKPVEEILDLECNVVKPEKVASEEILNEEDVDIEKIISANIGFDEKVFTSEDIPVTPDMNIFEEDKQKSDIEADNPPSTALQSSETTSESAEDDKGTSRKFYKSRSVSKKQIYSEEETEKTTEITSPNKQGTKRTLKTVKSENENLSQVSVNEQLLLAAKEAEEATLCKMPDKSPTKAEIKSPASKKPRIFEKMTIKEIKEMKELSEDDTPIAKRPGRKAKKGRRPAKVVTPVKQDEPKDQYEFSESTEENSVGYQTTNTLCYMPRLKDDRHEEPKAKPSQNSESLTAVASNTSEKKHGTPTKKSGRLLSQSPAQKSLYASDEERMSDSMTSDDASSSHFDDDKLRKWKDFSDKKEEDCTKLQKEAKVVDTPKKKLQHTKRNLFSSKSDSAKKDKKNDQSDVEESSACSRDSEDAISTTAWQREEAELLETKNNSSNVANEVEMETNDSHMSSSVTAESDTKIDEMEGCESLQGSITAEFSPLAETDIKEEKDSSQFGKQDWFQGVSPKSSEAVSQSSEESEYESDNWDSQSVSTNKSASHSASTSSKSKRKDRESPQYKAWKKAISIVLREASCHKYANVFLQKVTNDVAPGYLNIVYRPMDLSLLKKNVDNGVVKTSAEVHRDMLLMFQNAVMYNSSDHDVHHMAVEMQRDVIQQIQAFLTTQYNDKDESNELTSLRGARAKSQKVYGSTLKPKEESHEKE